MTNYDERIRLLQNELNSYNKTTQPASTSTPSTSSSNFVSSIKEKCTPSVVLYAIFVPFAWWLILFWLKPGIVLKKEGSRQIRSHTKVFGWTIVLTVVSWIILYAYYYFKGSSMVCMKS